MTIDTARCECATCTTNPDPRRFYMNLIAGVKHVSDANAPNVSVPFCFAHERWPCIDCGTKHGDDCECPYCTEPAPSNTAFSNTQFDKPVEFRSEDYVISNHEGLPCGDGVYVKGTEPAPSAGVSISNDDLLGLAQSPRQVTVEEVADLCSDLSEARSRIAALESRQPQSAEWVPWKPGDALPERGAYVVTCKPQEGMSSRYRKVLRTDHDLWRDWEVVAYLSTPLPPPYVPETT